MDQNKVTCLILLDLNAAFNTVDHELLLNCLRYTYGVSGQALEWICSYLTGRTQWVVIGNPSSRGAESEKAPLAQGVPQVSVLGPILSTLYVSPLGNICRNHGIDFHSYTDNQQNYCAFSPMVPDSKDLCLGQLESCLSNVRTWMWTNLLKLNNSKTEFLLLGTQHQLSSVGTHKIKIGEDCIKSVSCARNLSFWMNGDLNNKTHINKLVSTLHQSLKGIEKIRQLVDKETCQTMIQALITSGLDYCNSLLLGSAEAVIDKLQKVQSMACHIVVCNVNMITYIRTCKAFIGLRYVREYYTRLWSWSSSALEETPHNTWRISW